MNAFSVITLFISGLLFGGVVMDLFWRHTLRRSTHRHVMTDKEYVSYGEFELKDTHPAIDGNSITAYKSVKTGRGWAQPSDRFEDGRFEKL